MKSTFMKKQKPTEFKLTQEYILSVNSKSYLGKKGYTIPKSALSSIDLEFLRKELFVKPIVPGVNYNPQSDDANAFPVFRENANKMYLPRFYGIERYGVVSKTEISEGDNIDLQFAKQLRDVQTKIVDVYMKHVQNPICSESNINGGGGILEVFCGAGKTVMALNIISLLHKKTLIIVHKEFLMNQWIERINEFLPTARIGKIQGKIFDIENKDIVIGMVQTLYDKEYNSNTFSSFGLTIIDEVHRIGSEQFSRTLIKIITPYMLGISATVDRKDKLTRVLYMFIGDKIYAQQREAEDVVRVRAIKYINADNKFNEVELDFRGNAKYSTMISKLCGFDPRSDFIVRVVADLLN